MKNKSLQFGLSFLLSIIFLSLAIASGDEKNSNDSPSTEKKSNSGSGSNSSKSNSTSCIGNQGCISNVRTNFRSSGKQILGEEYLGNGIFGISFLDPQRGEAYNAKVYTDCNCGIKNVSVSMMR